MTTFVITITIIIAFTLVCMDQYNELDENRRLSTLAWTFGVIMVLGGLLYIVFGSPMLGLATMAVASIHTAVVMVRDAVFPRATALMACVLSVFAVVGWFYLATTAPLM